MVGSLLRQKWTKAILKSEEFVEKANLTLLPPEIERLRSC